MESIWEQKINLMFGEPVTSDSGGGETSVGGNSSVGRASAFQAEGRGFEPRFPLHTFFAGVFTLFRIVPASLSWDRFFPFLLAHVAQSVEHFLGKEEVIGPIPIVGSRILNERQGGRSHVKAEV